MGILTRLLNLKSTTEIAPVEKPSEIQSNDISMLREQVRGEAHRELAEQRAGESVPDRQFAQKVDATIDRILVPVYEDRTSTFDESTCIAILHAKERHDGYRVSQALASPSRVTARDIADIAYFFDILHEYGIHNSAYMTALRIFRSADDSFSRYENLSLHDQEWARSVMRVVSYFTAESVKGTGTKLAKSLVSVESIGQVPASVTMLLRRNPECADQLISAAAERSLTMHTIDVEMLLSACPAGTHAPVNSVS